MPNHSIKKTANLQNSITIDEKHSQLLEEFEALENTVIPDIEARLASLKRDAKQMAEGGTIEARMELKDQIRDLSAELRTLRKRRQKYLLENAQSIFAYFEEKKRISSGSDKQTKTVLNDFFKVKPSGVDDVMQNPKYQNSRLLYQNYWRNVNKEMCNMSDFAVSVDLCQRCKTGELIPQDEDGVLICNNPQCSVYVQHIVDNEKPTYKEPPNEVTYNAYVRLNHFKEILSQFQAKETTQIPADVMEKIKQRIKKERITNLATEINYEKMREILKKLELNRYFEHIQYINSILGIKPPMMSDELQDTLCILFIEIQEPWAIHCPAHRTNFFNCTYTLYQLCVLLDQTQYLPFIPMMKDREKQLEQDMVWKKVCESLDWEFVPTV